MFLANMPHPSDKAMDGTIRLHNFLAIGHLFDEKK